MSHTTVCNDGHLCDPREKAARHYWARLQRRPAKVTVQWFLLQRVVGTAQDSAYLSMDLKTSMLTEVLMIRDLVSATIKKTCETIMVHFDAH